MKISYVNDNYYQIYQIKKIIQIHLLIVLIYGMINIVFIMQCHYVKCELFDYISAHFNNNPTMYLQPHQTDNIPMRYPNQWIKNITYIFYQICTAIQWLHNNGFCHLDLSLENVMIYNLQNLSIKVIDFGLT
eukprot:126082_1